jgi:hypothetical protein
VLSGPEQHHEQVEVGNRHPIAEQIIVLQRTGEIAHARYDDLAGLRLVLVAAPGEERFEPLVVSVEMQASAYGK